MKRLFLHTFLLFILTVFTAPLTTHAQSVLPNRALDNSFLQHDGVMRYYRVALPVTYTCLQQSFGNDKNAVRDFWREAEDFLNQVYIPIGICMQVIQDDRLMMTKTNVVDSSPYNATGWGTDLINEIVGEKAYDIGLWLSEPADWDNSGVSILGGAYGTGTKAGGYSQPNIITVAHEMGHLFGAVHTHDEGAMTEPGLGQSVMGYGNPSDFLSLASMKAIFDMNKEKNAAYYSDEARTKLVGNNAGGNYVYGIKPGNNKAPQIDVTKMSERYRVPQGGCFALPIFATDTDGDRITYVFQQYEDGASFHAYGPSASSVIDFHPQYTMFPYDDYLFIDDGTDLPQMPAGTYNFIAAVNDLPTSSQMNYDALVANPFCPKYSIFKTQIEIVAGTPFSATLSPNKTHYSAGESVQVKWGINSSLFDSNTRVRITMSDNFGKTYDHILAEGIPAKNGSCEVVLPLLSFGELNQTFGKGNRNVRPGIIRIEIEGGIAYTLTCTSPENSGAAGGFTMSGGTPTSIQRPHITTTDAIYDLNGRLIKQGATQISDLPTGIYIHKGQKIYRK